MAFPCISNTFTSKIINLMHNSPLNCLAELQEAPDLVRDYGDDGDRAWDCLYSGSRDILQQWDVPSLLWLELGIHRLLPLDRTSPSE